MLPVPPIKRICMTSGQSWNILGQEAQNAKQTSWWRQCEVKNLVTIKVNGVPQRQDVEPSTLLVHFLRDHCHLTGTHVGCETSLCGACTVLLDGMAVKSCTLFAVRADGSEVTTIEGLARGGKLHPVQQGFWE